MRNLKLTLSYDGTDFNGWQTQPGYRTVQETLEAAIAALTGEPRVHLNASGRTDAVAGDGIGPPQKARKNGAPPYW